MVTEPKTVKDLKFAYDTTSYCFGNIEYESYKVEKEGDTSERYIRVHPNVSSDVVEVEVGHEEVYRVERYFDRLSSYSSRHVIDWKKTYTFDEFKESPFWDMTLKKWGEHWRTRWDASKIDERGCTYGDGYTDMYVHVYEYEHRGLFGNWEKTGKIDSVQVSVADEGDISLTINDRCFYHGDIHDLKKMVEEHVKMTENIKKLGERGIDLEDGTLSIKLWGD